MSLHITTPHADSAPTGPTILIVEDNQDIARALGKLLRLQHYRTEICYRGGDALDFARQHPIAAAVVDVHLPDINGLVLSRQLREHCGADVPIIVLSGDTSMETLNSLPHVGATYFFSKPVNAANLLDRLKEWVPVNGRAKA